MQFYSERQTQRKKKKVKKCQDAEASRNGLFTALYRHTSKDTDKTVKLLTRESRYHNRDSKWVLSILQCTSLVTSTCTFSLPPGRNAKYKPK
jgi:hypothetical protein